LKQSWNGYRSFFSRSAAVQPYLGTQLVLLSRALTAAGEAVQDVYFTMDSVFLGPAERQTIELDFVDVNQPVLDSNGRSVPDPNPPGIPLAGQGRLLTHLPRVTGDTDVEGDPTTYRFPRRFLGQNNPRTDLSLTAPLFVSELMDWTARFTMEEASSLIQSS